MFPFRIIFREIFSSFFSRRLRIIFIVKFSQYFFAKFSHYFFRIFSKRTQCENKAKRSRKKCEIFAKRFLLFAGNPSYRIKTFIFEKSLKMEKITFVKNNYFEKGKLIGGGVENTPLHQY